MPDQPVIHRRKTGVVVSDKMEKTVVVAIHESHRHPIYHKAEKRSVRLFAHDPENRWHTGDTVVIEETKPYAKHKSWQVVSGRSVEATVQPEIVDEVTT